MFDPYDSRHDQLVGRLALAGVGAFLIAVGMAVIVFAFVVLR